MGSIFNPEKFPNLDALLFKYKQQIHFKGGKEIGDRIKT